MPLFALFVVVPLVEIALFVEIGDVIGLWATLLIVVASAFAGVRIIRSQGAATSAALQQALAEFRDPGTPLAHGALKVLAGFLLIFPGFFTDACGLLLLIPGVRAFLIARFGRRMRTAHAGFGTVSGAEAPHRYGGGTVIDGDYIDETTPAPDDSGGPQRPSGWTRPDVDD